MYRHTHQSHDLAPHQITSRGHGQELPCRPESRTTNSKTLFFGQFFETILWFLVPHQYFGQMTSNKEGRHCHSWWLAWGQDFEMCSPRWGSHGRLPKGSLPSQDDKCRWGGMEKFTVHTTVHKKKTKKASASLKLVIWDAAFLYRFLNSWFLLAFFKLTCNKLDPTWKTKQVYKNIKEGIVTCFIFAHRRWRCTHLRPLDIGLNNKKVSH